MYAPGAPVVDTVEWLSGSGAISLSLGPTIPLRAIWFPTLPENVTLSFSDHNTGDVFYSLTDTGSERIDVPSLGATSLPITQVDVAASPNLAANLFVTFTNFAWQPFKSGSSSGSSSGGGCGEYNVLDYGATNDGSTDSTDAFQKADIAAYLAGGGTVCAPPGVYFFNGGSGTIPNPAAPPSQPAGGVCPIGPVLVHDNVSIHGAGMWQTLFNQGPNYYNGTIPRPPKTPGPPSSTNASTLFANNGYWLGNTGTTPISQHCSISDLSICGNGHLAPGAGEIEPPAATILTNATVEFHAVLYGNIDRVNVYDTYGNGIINYGINEPSEPSQVVPVNGRVSECVVNLNYPIWLSGSSWFDHPGQPGGSLPIRTVGCDNMEVTRNIIGWLNVGRTNDPFLPGNTNDGIDCPTTSNLLCAQNRITLCGDGIGTNGMFNVNLSDNLVIDAGSVGLASYKSTLGSATSIINILGNIVINAGSNGPANASLQIDSGSSQMTVGTNIFVSAFGTAPSIVNFLGDNLSFINNYIGMMGAANSIGARLSGTLTNSIVSGNIFDFGGAISSIGLKLGTLSNVIADSNVFANAGATGCIGVHLPTANTYNRLLLAHNTFDSTIDDTSSPNVPLQIDVAFSALTKCLLVPNIGIGGAWLNSTFSQASVTPSPNPPFTTPFHNPFPWPCQVWLGDSGVFTGPVILDGVTMPGATTAPTAGGFVARVPMDSTIALQWSTKPNGASGAGWHWYFEAN